QEVRAERDLHDMVGAEHTDHLRIIDAILAGDPAVAAEAMEAHMLAVESFRSAPCPARSTPRRGPAAPSRPKGPAMRALEIHGPDDLRVVDRPAPDPAPGEVQIAVEWGGVCGSDIAYWRSGVSGT